MWFDEYVTKGDDIERSEDKVLLNVLDVTVSDVV